MKGVLYGGYAAPTPIWLSRWGEGTTFSNLRIAEGLVRLARRAARCACAADPDASMHMHRGRMYGYMLHSVTLKLSAKDVVEFAPSALR